MPDMLPSTSYINEKSSSHEINRKHELYIKTRVSFSSIADEWDDPRMDVYNGYGERI